MPKGAVHAGFNFGQKKMRAFSCSPGIVDDQLFPTDMAGKWNLYKRAGREKDFPAPKPWLEPNKLGSINDLGKWPVDFTELRKPPQYLYPVREEDKLHIVHGLEYPVLMKISVSNETIQVGEYIIPSGGIQCRMSEPESHKGDACIFLLEGEMGVFMTKTRETFKLYPEEAIFIPEGHEYSLINYGNTGIRAAFVIAPGF